MDVGSAYEVLFTYIKLLAILVQLEFLFFRHLDQLIRGISETFKEEAKQSHMFDFLVVQIVPSLSERAEAI